MKSIPYVMYVLIVCVCMFLPTSVGYDTFWWKILIAQVYAIPAFLIVFLIYKGLSK